MGACWQLAGRALAGLGGRCIYSILIEDKWQVF
jgi:hypothetical protein